MTPGMYLLSTAGARLLVHLDALGGLLRRREVWEWSYGPPRENEDFLRKLPPDRRRERYHRLGFMATRRFSTPWRVQLPFRRFAADDAAAERALQGGVLHPDSFLARS